MNTKDGAYIKDNHINDSIEKYNQNGFAIINIFNEDQVQLIETFAKEWIKSLLEPWLNCEKGILSLESYHKWPADLQIKHEEIFCAKNRHMNPDSKIELVLLNSHLKDYLKIIGIDRFNVWNEGLGWLAFRFIRPNMGDGYPFTKKSWGIAKKVISCWVPVLGYSPRETISVVPGSHHQEYNKYLPTNGKFRKDEYRLATSPDDLELYSPALKRGEIIIYHPDTLHSEDVLFSEITRLNLEFRIDPC